MPEPEAFHYMLRTVEVVLKAERDGQERRNVLHYRYGALRPTVDELEGLLQEVENQVIDQYENAVTIGTRFYEVTARDMETEDGAIATRTMNRVGSGGTQVLPANVSICMSKRCGRAGRSFQGRFYMFDLPEDFMNGSTINPVYLGLLTTIASRLQVPLWGGQFVPAVGSRKLGGSTPINAITFDLVGDSQRRRLPGRGD